MIHKPGQKVKTTSPLHVSWEERQLGETTDQYIRRPAGAGKPRPAVNP